MPIIKSAKKRLRQNVKRRARNYPLRSEVKTCIKKVLEFIKDGNTEEAQKFLPYTYKIIDMACKKNILHSNNAARKKSRIARALNELTSKKGGAEGVGKAGKAEEAAPEGKVEEKVE